MEPLNGGMNIEDEDVVFKNTLEDQDDEGLATKKVKKGKKGKGKTGNKKKNKKSIDAGNNEANLNDTGDENEIIPDLASKPVSPKKAKSPGKKAGGKKGKKGKKGDD